MSRLSLPRRKPFMGMDTSLAIVNVVFLMIFFFMVAGQDAAPETDVMPPETRDLPLDRLPSPILVVGADGAWSLNGQMISAELLPVAMAGQGDTLYLLIDREAPSSALINIMAQPGLSDFRIVLVTLREQVTQ